MGSDQEVVRPDRRSMARQVIADCRVVAVGAWFEGQYLKGGQYQIDTFRKRPRPRLRRAVTKLGRHRGARADGILPYSGNPGGQGPLRLPDQFRQRVGTLELIT